jgi:ankyrin repeat protein
LSLSEIQGRLEKLTGCICNDGPDITDIYVSALASTRKDVVEWQAQFKKGDWSDWELLRYLTWGKIDAEQLTKFELSARILDPNKVGAVRAALVLALLQSDVDPDKYLAGAVGFFAERGNIALLRVLLDFGANPNGTAPGKVDTPLVRAAEAGQVAAIDILLRSAKISPAINTIPADALIRAIDMEQVAAVNRLLEDPRIGLLSGMWRALEDSHVEIFRLFLKDPRMHQKNIQRMLYVAAKESSPDVVKLLLDDPRVDPNEGDSNSTPLYSAVDNDRSDIVKVLLEHPRIDLSMGNYFSGLTPFGRAIRWPENRAPEDLEIIEDLEIMRLLIEDRRFKVNLEYPLHQAVKRGNPVIVSELISLERIRDILNLTDDSGRTALEVVDSDNPEYTEIANLLRNAGARSSKPSKGGHQVSEKEATACNDMIGGVRPKEG